MKQGVEGGDRTKADPGRFEYYTELSNGEGFKLDDGLVFYYDKYGGWYDEYDNYYDCNGDYISNPSLSGESSFQSSYEERYAMYDGLQDDLLNEYVDYGENRRNNNQSNRNKYSESNKYKNNHRDQYNNRDNHNRNNRDNYNNRDNQNNRDNNSNSNRHHHNNNYNNNNNQKWGKNQNNSNNNGNNNESIKEMISRMENGVPIVIELYNVNFKVNHARVKEFLGQQDVMKLIIDFHDDSYRKKGTGRVVVGSKEQAYRVIQKQGQSLDGINIQMQFQEQSQYNLQVLLGNNHYNQQSHNNNNQINYNNNNSIKYSNNNQMKYNNNKDNNQNQNQNQKMRFYNENYQNNPQQMNYSNQQQMQMNYHNLNINMRFSNNNMGQYNMQQMPMYNQQIHQYDNRNVNRPINNESNVQMNIHQQMDYNHQHKINNNQQQHYKLNNNQQKMQNRPDYDEFKEVKKNKSYQDELTNEIGKIKVSGKESNQNQFEVLNQRNIPKMQKKNK